MNPVKTVVVSIAWGSLDLHAPSCDERAETAYRMTSSSNLRQGSVWTDTLFETINQEFISQKEQGISLSEICAPPWKVKTFMVTRWDLQSKFRWSLTAWTMLFTTTLALLVKRKYFILNLIGRQRVIPCTSDSKQFN